MISGDCLSVDSFPKGSFTRLKNGHYGGLGFRFTGQVSVLEGGLSRDQGTLVGGDCARLMWLGVTRSQSLAASRVPEVGLLAAFTPHFVSASSPPPPDLSRPQEQLPSLFPQDPNPRCSAKFPSD
jgi:hypothetical protein